MMQLLSSTTPGIGTYQIGETVYQGFSATNATAYGKVISWNNNILKLTNVNGNFISSQPIYGVNNNASYVFNSYSKDGPISNTMVTITSTPSPNTANANSLYTYATKIVERG